MKKYELVNDAGQVNYEYWAALGVKAVLFDKDGTLTHPNQLTLVDGVIEKLQAQELDRLFTQIGISSNNHDPTSVVALAELLQEKLNIGVVAVSRGDYKRKPHPEMGLAAAQKIGISPTELGVVGDRRYTDVRFGFNVGARAVALCDKSGEGDSPFVPAIRKLERAWVATDKALRRAA